MYWGRTGAARLRLSVDYRCLKYEEKIRKNGREKGKTGGCEAVRAGRNVIIRSCLAPVTVVEREAMGERRER